MSFVVVGSTTFPWLVAYVLLFQRNDWRNKFGLF
jgi:hypothetical protein